MSAPGEGGGGEQERGVQSETERLEREELSRGQLAPGAEPVPPRPAATIVLARDDGRGAFEVLLLERPASAAFAAGAFVFPGGTIDVEDDEPGLLARLPSRFVGPEAMALAAGLRELFEETGLLLSDEAVPAPQLEAARRDLLAGHRSFARVAAELEVAFRRLRVEYFARWITPAAFARRYDARFFLAELSGPAAAREPVLTDELVTYRWLSPSEAVSGFAAGELPLLFPTRVTLTRLAERSDLNEAFAAAAAAPVETVQPRLIVSGDSVRPVLPGEPGYESPGQANA